MKNRKVLFVLLTCAVTCMSGCATSSTRLQMRIDELDRQLETQELRYRKAEEEALRFEGVGGHPTNASMTHHIETLPPDKKARFREISEAVKVEEARYGELWRERHESELSS